MGDVTYRLNNTSSAGGGNKGDDEDAWNELSGSGDGDVTNSPSTRSPDGSSSHGSSGGSKGKHTEVDNLLIYIISASIVFAVIIIIIVVVIICCRRKAKQRSARQKPQLPALGTDMKIMTTNRETRVFRNISGGDTMEFRSVEHERELSRLLGPPTSIAPPPPTAAAAETERLLKATNSNFVSPSKHHNSQGRPQLELTQMYPSQMHPSEVAETPIYEEIGNTAKSKVTNKEDNADIYDENSQAHTNSQGHSNIKDRYQDNKHIAVAKPRKTPRNNKVIQETTEGYIQAQPKEYSV